MCGEMGLKPGAKKRNAGRDRLHLGDDYLTEAAMLKDEVLRRRLRHEQIKKNGGVATRLYM